MIRPVGIRDSGDSGHLGAEYPLREILVGIPDSGDSGQWVFRIVGIPGGNLPEAIPNHNPNCNI